MRVQKHIVSFVAVSSMFLLLRSNLMAQELPEPFPPMTEAFEALESDQDVTVREIKVEEWEEDSNYYYAFEPQGEKSTVGFIIYPGGLVDPVSYAPTAHTLAAKGYLTVIVKMMRDLAIGQSVQRATKIIDDYPVIEKWVIGGHSMGGVGACAYARNFPENIVGVVLWASYPSDFFRIDDKELSVISIYGMKDGLATVDEDIEPSAEHLPPDTHWAPIEGGNHTQFGWYDTSPDPVQPGDNFADITREEQQKQIVQTTAGFLDQFVETTLSTCPIVSIYGEHSSETELLRLFRNNALTKNPQGRELIKLYYQWSPIIMEAIEKDQGYKKEAKEMIDEILSYIKILVE